ncbi:hypothetical protein F0562_034238 [Nyssa sinensis]|uniref:Sieve element occlusion N-terminal domain-containing protein n=1 Tax=Nyssa sinensis TaxID=561372 RepID=A0A5J5AIF5_9ASTE|nr:hypothetical protein F0562_034238 [Nyssa sinensis]
MFSIMNSASPKLFSMESILCYATTTEGSDLHFDTIARSNICNIEVTGSEEPLGHTIYKISHEILWQCSADGNLHAKTMILFDALGHYRWEAKLVLILAAFATNYGEFWLIMQLYPRNPLAASVAMLKRLPNDLSALKPRFKALGLLIKTMVDVTKCIMKFERLQLQQVVLDYEAMAVTKSQIYMATYWVIRSTLTCSSQNFLFRHSDSSTIAIWELSSLVCRLSGIFSRLRQQVDVCLQLLETQMHIKLLNVFKETHIDNQEVLNLLFSLNDDLPLKDCSSEAKLAVSELKNQVALLLISKPDLPLEELLLLVQQTCDHTDQEKLKGSYKIVWVPIPSSTTWSRAEEISFDFLSNCLPWYSVRQPWLLSLTVPKWVEDKRNFCICGSDNLDWIREVNAKMREISSVGVQVEMLYVGKNNPTEHTRSILATIDKEMTSFSLTSMKMQFFWLRLESMRRSKLRLGYTHDNDFILRETSGLLDPDENEKGWVIIGRGSSTEIIKLQGEKVMECLNLFSTWGENVAKLGLVDAIRTALEPPLVTGPCDHSNVIPYVEGLMEGTAVCNICKRPMQKFIVYKCDGIVGSSSQQLGKKGKSIFRN